jgi:hypothetical protein
MKYQTISIFFLGCIMSQFAFAENIVSLTSSPVQSIELRANGLDKIPVDFVGALTIQAVVEVSVLSGECTPNGPSQFLIPGPSWGTYSLGYQRPQCLSFATAESVTFDTLHLIIRDPSELDMLRNKTINVNGKLKTLSTLF